MIIKPQNLLLEFLEVLILVFFPGVEDTTNTMLRMVRLETPPILASLRTLVSNGANRAYLLLAQNLIRAINVLRPIKKSFAQ